MLTTFRKLHYRVHALQDGTIWFAIPTRKPRRSRTSGEPAIDEDGIYSWYLEKPGNDEHNNYSDWGKGLWHTCAAMSLNVRRIVRQQVGTRLDAEKKQLMAMQDQLDRIEEKLDRLLATPVSQ
jgi:hypothetical protein